MSVHGRASAPQLAHVHHYWAHALSLPQHCVAASSLNSPEVAGRDARNEVLGRYNLTVDPCELGRVRANTLMRKTLEGVRAEAEQAKLAQSDMRAARRRPAEVAIASGDGAGALRRMTASLDETSLRGHAWANASRVHDDAGERRQREHTQHAADTALRIRGGSHGRDEMLHTSVEQFSSGGAARQGHARRRLEEAHAGSALSAVALPLVNTTPPATRPQATVAHQDMLAVVRGGQQEQVRFCRTSCCTAHNAAMRLQIPTLVLQRFSASSTQFRAGAARCAGAR